jgi:23S rRNA pseudouridine1911/1915/1917 synthase
MGGENVRYIIEVCHDGMLLRNYLLGVANISRRLLTRLKNTPNGILLNGQAVTVRALLHTGDVLQLAWEDSSVTPRGNIVPSDVLPDIVYEDDDILVCNKPGGMPTHPSHGHFDDTLANAVARYDLNTKGHIGVFRPVNRLDRDTSGIVLIARHQWAAARLSAAMKNGHIQKNYFAVLEGTLPSPAGTIDAPIRRAQASIITREVCLPNADGAHTALTRYHVIATWCIGPYERTLVKAEPLTGRTHQLRLHFTHLGAPIAGDTLYGLSHTDLLPPARQALHAASLTFPHPTTGKPMTLSTPLSEDIRSLLPMHCQ